MSCSWMGTSTWSLDGMAVTVSLASPAFSSSQPGWGRPVWSWIDSCTFRFLRLGSLTCTTPAGRERDRLVHVQVLSHALLDLDHVARLDLVGGDVDLLAVDGHVGVPDQLACLVAGPGQAAPGGR